MDRRTFLFAAAATLAYARHAPAGEIARVGLVLPLTGERAAEGMLARDAALAALDLANRERHPGRPLILAEIHDSRGEGGRFLAGLRKLADDKAVSVFGLCPPDSRTAMTELLTTRDALFWDPEPAEPGGCGGPVIHGGPTPNQSLGALLPFMTAEVGRRVLVIGDAGGRRRALLDAAWAMVEVRATPVGAPALVERRDFAPILRRIRRERVDVVLSVLDGTAQLDFLRAYRAARFDPLEIPIASPTLTEADMAAAGPGIASGHIAVQPYFSTWRSPENEVFLAALRRRAGPGAVPGPLVETLWWQIRLFAKALDALGAGELHPITVREAARDREVAAPQGRIRLDGATLRAALWPKIAVVDQAGRAKVLAHTARPLVPQGCPEI